MKIKIFSVITVLVLALSLSVMTVFAQDNIEINTTNFPDVAFMEYVKVFDKNSDGFLASDEIAEVVFVDVGEENISSLTGIEYFTNLTNLKANNNLLTAVDLSSNTALTDVDLSFNSLQELDLESSFGLVNLNLSNNQAFSNLILSDNNDELETLNLSSCALDIISLSDYTALKSLDLSGNITLEELEILDTTLTELNISACTGLTRVYVKNNLLEKIDISGCTGVDELDVSNNQLEKIEISDCENLTYLDITSNKLTEINVSGLVALTQLYAGKNLLTKIDISGLVALEKLYVNNNKLTEIDASTCVALYRLLAEENSLTKLDISACANLSDLDINNNNLVELDLSANKNLEYIIVSNNQLKELDLSGCAQLSYIDAYNNKLTKLNLNGCVALESLDLELNSLTELDLSEYVNLLYLNTKSNSLTTLDLSKNINLINAFLNAVDGAQTGKTLYYTKNGNNYVINLAEQFGLDEADFGRIMLADGQSATYDAKTGIVTFTSMPTNLMYTYDAKNNEKGTSVERYMNVECTVERDSADKDPETPTPETPSPETPTPEMPNPETPVETATVKGRLLDKDGNPMANVVVAMFSDPVWAFTDADGYYTLTNVPMGTHTLRVFATQADFESYMADLKAGITPSVKPLFEIANVTISKDVNANTIININGTLYTNGNFFIQLNADKTVSVTNIMPTTLPKTVDTNNQALYLVLLAISISGLVSIKKCNKKYN